MSRSDDGKVNGETVIGKLDATSHGHRYRWLLSYPLNRSDSILLGWHSPGPVGRWSFHAGGLASARDRRVASLLWVLRARSSDEVAVSDRVVVDRAFEEAVKE